MLDTPPRTNDTPWHVCPEPSQACLSGQNPGGYCSSDSWECHALTRLVVHHTDGFGFGQLQRRHPSLPLHLCAGLQMIRAAAAAQHDVAGVLRVDVRGGQVDRSAARVGHLRLGPAANEWEDEGRESNLASFKTHSLGMQSKNDFEIRGTVLWFGTLCIKTGERPKLSYDGLIRLNDGTLV